jgi:hypothetical protein
VFVRTYAVPQSLLYTAAAAVQFKCLGLLHLVWSTIVSYVLQHVMCLN